MLGFCIPHLCYRWYYDSCYALASSCFMYLGVCLGAWHIFLVTRPFWKYLCRGLFLFFHLCGNFWARKMFRMSQTVFISVSFQVRKNLKLCNDLGVLKLCTPVCTWSVYLATMCMILPSASKWCSFGLWVASSNTTLPLNCMTAVTIV